MSIEFKIGCDPELFLLDTETGKHVSAFGMIPGTKHDPFKVEGGAVQVDGMALEFNIDPVTQLKDWHKNIGQVLKQLREMVPARYKFDFTPVAHFGKEYIDAQCDEAKALGCDPDFDAWADGAINPKPDGNMGIRTASGHVHIGWTEDQDVTDPEHIAACIMLTKQLDYYLGVPSLIWDKNSERRSMYGAPGAFRPKRYGVEYRTMSNAWVDDSDLRAYVFNMARQGAIKLINGHRIYENLVNVRPYTKMLFEQASWNTIAEVTTGYIHYATDADYRYMEQLVLKNIKAGKRAEQVDYEKKMEEGYFKNPETYELIPYEDVSWEDYQNGFQNPHDVYRYAKHAKAPKPEFMTNLEYQKSRMIKGVKPSEMIYAGAGGNLNKAVWDLAFGVNPAKPVKIKKAAVPFPAAPKPMFDIDDLDEAPEF